MKRGINIPGKLISLSADEREHFIYTDISGECVNIPSQ